MCLLYFAAAFLGIQPQVDADDGVGGVLLGVGVGASALEGIWD